MSIAKNSSSPRQYEKFYEKSRQNQEKLQSHQEFLNKFMKEYSISVKTSMAQKFQEPPKSPNTSKKLISPISPIAKTLIQSPFSGISTRKTKDFSPSSNFYELKQNYFPENIKEESDGPPKEMIMESSVIQQGPSVINDVDKLIDKIKRKHESWNLVEEKLVGNMNYMQTAKKQEANPKFQNSFDLGDVDSLIERVKQKIGYRGQDEPSTNEIALQNVAFDSSTRIKETNKFDTNPNVKVQTKDNSNSDFEPKKKFNEKSFEEQEDPMRLNKQVNIQSLSKSAFKSKTKEDNEQELLINDKSKVRFLQNDENRHQINNSSYPSDTLSFNISDSLPISQGVVTQKGNDDKENLSGKMSLKMSMSPDKLALDLSKSLTIQEGLENEQIKSNNFVKQLKNIQKKSVDVKLGNEKNDSPLKKTIDSNKLNSKAKNERTFNEKDTKPKFYNSFKSRIGQLKNIYANKVSIENLPQNNDNHSKNSDSPPQRDKPERKKENREENSLYEDKRQNFRKRSEGENQNELKEYDIISPEKESFFKSKGVHSESGSSFDHLMSYSKAAEEKIGIVEEIAEKIPPDNQRENQFINLSPMPKRQIDFEKASEISFNYSPEESLLYTDAIKAKDNNIRINKSINLQEVSTELMQSIWSEQMERDFEAYCDKDPEIIKLKNKITYLKGEIKLAFMN